MDNMEDTLEVRVMTIDELKSNPPIIDKKFVLINSSLYTDEAYEYLLELINETDSIAFIRDRKQIYTKGEYFGGDVWESNLLCFGSFQLINDNDDVYAQLSAEVLNDNVRFKGENNITLVGEEYYVHGEKYKTIKIGYDIANSIDTSVFTIDDPTAQYNLEIKDSKIAVNKYIPIRINIRGDESFIEYDTKPEMIEFYLDIYGSSENKNIYVTSSANNIVYLSDDKTYATTTIDVNTDTKYLVIYSDEKTEGSTFFEKKYGYALVWGNEEITLGNFKELDRQITIGSCDCEFTINQEEGEFGWFACPSDFTPTFIDEFSGLRGGWTLANSITIYSSKIKYNIWKTEQSGLGNIKWSVKNIL